MTFPWGRSRFQKFSTPSASTRTVPKQASKFSTYPRFTFWVRSDWPARVCSGRILRIPTKTHKYRSLARGHFIRPGPLAMRTSQALDSTSRPHLPYILTSLFPTHPNQSLSPSLDSEEGKPTHPLRFSSTAVFSLNKTFSHFLIFIYYSRQLGNSF